MRDPEPREWWARLARAMQGRDGRRTPARYTARSVPRTYHPSVSTVAPPNRHPARGGSQARRQGGSNLAYVIGYAVIVAILGTIALVGYNWLTGPGRVAGLAVSPTPGPTIVIPAAVPPVASSPVASLSPLPEARTYIVKAGDNPAAIARQFGTTAEELLKENNIADPRTLQVGQSLRIPAPSTR